MQTRLLWCPLFFGGLLTSLVGGAVFPAPALAVSLRLTWHKPKTNADGTELNDLAGFKIHFGENSGQYSQTVDAGNGNSYLLEDIPTGKTYYFVATAYDTSGLESENSNEV